MEYLTKDLCIRPFQSGDREGMVALLTNETIAKTYMLPDFSCREEAEKLFTRLMELSARNDRFICAICLNGQCIGMVNDTEIKDDSIELGYAILPQYHNRGYCTQMLRGAIEYLHMHGFSKVLTAAFECNGASLCVMEKCGMTKISYTEEITYRGQTHRCIYYCAEREE